MAGMGCQAETRVGVGFQMETHMGTRKVWDTVWRFRWGPGHQVETQAGLGPVLCASQRLMQAWDQLEVSGRDSGALGALNRDSLGPGSDVM